MNEIDFDSLWLQCLDQANERLGLTDVPDLDRKQEASLAKETISDFILELYLRQVRSKSSTPWATLEKLDAARLIMIRLYHWTPTQLRELKPEDVKLALHDELTSFNIPAPADAVIREQTERIRKTRKLISSQMND